MAEPWSLVRKAAEYEKRGKFDQAWACYEQAADIFAGTGNSEESDRMSQRAQVCRVAALSARPSSTSVPQTTTAIPVSPSPSIPVATPIPGTGGERAARLYPDQPSISNPASSTFGGTRLSPSLSFPRSSPSPSAPPPPSPTPRTEQAPPQAQRKLGQAALDQARSHFSQVLSTTRPWISDFFDVKQWDLPSSASEASTRIKANLSFYKSNYLIVTLCVFLYVIVTHPIVLGLCLVLCGLVAWAREREARARQIASQIRQEGTRLTKIQKTLVAIVAVVLAFYVLTEAVSSFLFALLVAAFIVLIHASLHIPAPQQLREVDEEAGRAEAMAGRGEKEEGKCGVCLVEPQNAVFIPCGHVACMECATGIVDKAEKSRKRKPASCPICRSPIQSLNKLFV